MLLTIDLLNIVSRPILLGERQKVKNRLDLLSSVSPYGFPAPFVNPVLALPLCSLESVGFPPTPLNVGSRQGQEGSSRQQKDRLPPINHPPYSTPYAGIGADS